MSLLLSVAGYTCKWKKESVSYSLARVKVRSIPVTETALCFVAALHPGLLRLELVEELVPLPLLQWIYL